MRLFYSLGSAKAVDHCRVRYRPKSVASVGRRATHPAVSGDRVPALGSALRKLDPGEDVYVSQ
jgi:hypothetical protein